MQNAIAKNKRNTALIIIGFIAFFSAVATYVGYLLNNYWVTVGIIAFVFAFTIVQIFQAGRMSMALAGGVEIYKPEENPKLWAVVEKLSKAEGMPMPRVFIIPDDAPNAMAMGRDPEHAMVGATTGFIKMADLYELEGVMAHEMAHVKNYDIRVKTITFGLIGAFSAIAQACFLFSFGVFGGRSGRSGILLILFFPLALVLFVVGFVSYLISVVVGPLVFSAVSRQREYLADASGSLMTRHPEALMSALQKIEDYVEPVGRRNSAMASMYFKNPFKRGFFRNLFSSHPATEDRIDRLAELGSTRF
jgi:heat shock protein HtpX